MYPPLNAVSPNAISRTLCLRTLSPNAVSPNAVPPNAVSPNAVPPNAVSPNTAYHLLIESIQLIAYGGFLVSFPALKYEVVNVEKTLRGYGNGIGNGMQGMRVLVVRHQ